MTVQNPGSTLHRAPARQRRLHPCHPRIGIVTVVLDPVVQPILQEEHHSLFLPDSFCRQ